ncbi:MAG TPA: helix-turn-helix domain-containing protein [Acidimicrobiales bacterium]
MRRVAWSGDAPANEDDARRRIMEAAVRCVQRHGIERTSVAMIADEAGVSRPTLYAYFENRDEIVTQAAIAATDSFVERVVAHVRRFDTAAERLVEATLFTVRGIRREPALAMRFRAGGLLSGPLTADELHYAKICLAPVVELAPELEPWLDDAAEVSARVVISLLSRGPIHPRTESQEREFLHSWLPGALGLVPLDSRAARPLDRTR